MKEQLGFNLSSQGKTCHIDFEKSQFLSLGLNSLFSTENLFNLLYDKALSVRIAYEENKQQTYQAIQKAISQKKTKDWIVLAAVCLCSQASLHYQEESFNAQQKAAPVKKIPNHFLPSVFHSKLEAFTHLLLITEHKKNHFYEDNDGVAVGYGWNPTKNPKDFNLIVAKAMGLNKKEQKAIEAISDTNKVQHVPTNLKKIVFSEKQLKTSANIMMQAYEKEFLNVVKVKSKENNVDYTIVEKNYRSLPYNQQAVLLHMTYKVGAKRLLKYNIFFDKLFVYLADPSEQNLQQVSDNFEYSYKTRQGERIHDERVEQAHQRFFADCLKYQNNDKFKKERIDSCRQLMAQAETEANKARKNLS